MPKANFNREGPERGDMREMTEKDIIQSRKELFLLAAMLNRMGEVSHIRAEIAQRSLEFLIQNGGLGKEVDLLRKRVA